MDVHILKKPSPTKTYLDLKVTTFNMPTHPVDDIVLHGFDSIAQITIEQFMETLEQQFKLALPVSTMPYDKVQVFMFYFKEADFDSKGDVIAFSEFLKREFSFDTTIHEIGGSFRKPDVAALNLAVAAWSKKTTAKTLSIVYYAGHGWSNEPTKAEPRKSLVL